MPTKRGPDAAHRANTAGEGRCPVDRSLHCRTKRQQVGGPPFLDKIDAKLKFLAQHPLAGEARPELAADVRSFPVGNYVIFYRPSDDGINVFAFFTAPAIFRGFSGRVRIDRPFAVSLKLLL